MSTQWIQYLVAALVVVAIIYFWRKRARRLRLRIEPVPEARIDNSAVERNEIVGSVRVRPRDHAASEGVEEAVEPIVTDKPSIFMPASEANHSSPEIAEDEVLENAEPEPEQSAPALTQNDLFPEADTAADQQALGGIDQSELAFEQVISIHIMARDEQIPGRVLLEHLLQYGLRFGDMSIFHRHEHPTGQGAILFSLAQAMEPGTFDIDTLARDEVPGVSLFLGLPGHKSLVAYDLMIDTARRLTAALNAEMLDDSGQFLTAGKLADWRDEVAVFDSRSSV